METSYLYKIVVAADTAVSDTKLGEWMLLTVDGTIPEIVLGTKL